MSISVDESGPAWEVFLTAEKAKFPHFGKNWFDYNGVISADRNYRNWKWEIDQYREDRASFITHLAEVPQPGNSRAKPISEPEKAKLSNSSKVQANKEKKKVKSSNSSRVQSNKEKNINFVRAKHNSAHSTSMPRRTKRSQAWKNRPRRRRGGNKALASVKVPFKTVISVNSKESTTETGHWHNHLSIAELAGDALKLHEEFKCCSLKARFIPEDITSGSGLYAACLLDQNGFGDPAAATTTWFPRVADLPGARICHITRGCSFTWRPTEPDSRNYRKITEEKDYKVCSFYIFGNSKDLSIKGQLLVTGLLRARGEYYAANIARRIKELSLLDHDSVSLGSLDSTSVV